MEKLPQEGIETGKKQGREGPERELCEENGGRQGDGSLPLSPATHSPLHIHVLFLRAWLPDQRHCHRMIGDHGPRALPLLVHLLLFVSLEPLIGLFRVKGRNEGEVRSLLAQGRSVTFPAVQPLTRTLRPPAPPASDTFHLPPTSSQPMPPIRLVPRAPRQEDSGAGRDSG